MENPYNLHFYGQYSRQQALQEARRQYLIDQARASRRSRPGRNRIGTVLTRILSLRGGRVAT